MNALPSSAAIGEKIAALDVLVGDLGEEFDHKAMEAVAGVREAGKKAAEINSRIERLAVDRRILERAKVRAVDTEIAAAKAEAEADRQRHAANARAHAARLLEAAKRIDATTELFTAALSDLVDAEKAVRSELGRAKASPSDGIVGRNGLGILAVDRVSRVLDGRARSQGPGKTIEETALVAWGYLIEGDANG
jgi:hypothetical protein